MYLYGLGQLLHGGQGLTNRQRHDTARSFAIALLFGQRLLFLPGRIAERLSVVEHGQLPAH